MAGKLLELTDRGMFKLDRGSEIICSDEDCKCFELVVQEAKFLVRQAVLRAELKGQAREHALVIAQTLYDLMKLVGVSDVDAEGFAKWAVGWLGELCEPKKGDAA